MIAKKYTDANDNPALKVLASSAGRQWVGTETALDAALAAGTIKPGTVADTYMELEEPTVDYATVEYVRKNNKLAGWEAGPYVAPTAITVGAGTTNYVLPDSEMTMSYDGYVYSSPHWWGIVSGDISAVIYYLQYSSDGGTTWNSMPGCHLGSYPVNAMPLVLPFSKGDSIRAMYSITATTGGSIQTGFMSRINYYKERDYSE